MKNTLFYLLTLILSTTTVYSQITIQNTQTPANLVQNVLLGFGVTASNITINGNPGNANVVQGNVTYFDAAGTTFPIPNGVLLTTGNGIAAIGPNSQGSFTDNNPATPIVSYDADLNSIASATVTNGVVLEFDFIPSGDTILFNYVFGSDEYPEFSPSSYNDAFGFFLSGPGFAGPYQFGAVNLAVVPGSTTPVTINNVGPSSNTAYYVNNLNGAAYGNAIEYDGTTTLLSANASVQCGQTYHIKLCIANVGDQAYDSGVFLQANSFASEAIEISVAPTVAGDTSVFEGCTSADITFIRPISQSGDTLIVNYTVGGTATMGTDFANLPNPVVFLPGQDSVTLTINPFADGIPDNGEFIIFTATTISSCGDTLVSTGILYILDSIIVTIDDHDTIVPCVNDSILLSAFATGQFGPFTYVWQDGQTGTSAYFPTVSPGPTGSIDYIVTATNSCGYSGTDTVTLTLNQTLIIDSILTGPATCDPNGYATAFVSGNTGTIQYMWSGPTPDTTTMYPNASVITNLGGGWYNLTISDNVCMVSDSAFVDTEDVPVADFTANVTGGCSPLSVVFTNNSQNSNTYFWDFGNGNSTVTNDLNNVTQTFVTSSVVQMVASNGVASCNDTVSLAISISICGCTNPIALNYDSTATIDNGTCILPIVPAPIIVNIPNIITTNGDNNNDIFFLELINVETLDLVIINRWGEVVFEEKSANPGWDGKNKGGDPVKDGTYFYKYEATGFNGDILTGHGFVQVVTE